MKCINASDIKSTLNEFIFVKDDVNIIENVDINIANPILEICINCTGSLCKRGNAFIFTMQLEDREHLKKIHEHSNKLKYGEIIDDSHLYEIDLQVFHGVLIARDAQYVQNIFLSNMIEFAALNLEYRFFNPFPKHPKAELVILDKLQFIGSSITTTSEISPYRHITNQARDVEEIISCKYNVIIKQFQDQTRVVISKIDKSEVTEIDIECVLYSLSIVRTEMLYSSVPVKMIETGSDVLFLITANYLTNNKTKAMLPIYSNPDKFWDYKPLFIHLIDNFSDDNKDLYLSIIKLLHDSTQLMQTHLLSLCVTIESIVNCLPVKIKDDEVQQTNELIDSVMNQIDQHVDLNKDDELKNRFTGCINNIKNQKSAQSKLKKISEHSIISGDSFKLWRKIRNTFAHSSAMFDNPKSSEYISGIKHLYTMLYQLLFLTIGYPGEYTNYSEDEGDGYKKEKFAEKLAIFNAELICDAETE